MLILCSFLLNPHGAHSGSYTVVNTEAFSFYKNDKIIVSSIDGWTEAVEMLKASLTSSLLSMSTQKEDKAYYSISGNVFAKKHWRKRLYVYHNINLNIVDKQGNVVASIRNKKALWQLDLDKFADEIAKWLKKSMSSTERKKVSREVAKFTTPLHTNSIPKDPKLVYAFDKSSSEQIRALMTTVEGTLCLELRARAKII